MRFRIPFLCQRTSYLLLLLSSFATRGSHGAYTLDSASDVCGQELTGSDTFTMTQSIIRCGVDGFSTSGLTLKDTVTLNCNGGTIIGDGLTGIGATLEDSSTVIDCNFEDFEVGVMLDSSTKGGSLTITSIQANNNAVHGIYISGSAVNTLTGVTASNNIYYGIFVSGTFAMTTIAQAVLTGNSQGIFIKRDVSAAVVITGSTVSSNTFHGFVVQSREDVTISESTIQGNIRHGILATRFGASGDLIISEVRVTGNMKNGIVITGSQTATIEGSLINGNQQDGVAFRNVAPTLNCVELIGNQRFGLQTSSDMTVTNSRIYDNVSSNIEESSSSTVTADTKICESMTDCDNLDLSPECDAFILIKFQTVEVDANDICLPALPGQTIYLVPADASTIDCSTYGPRLQDDAILDCQGGTIMGDRAANSVGVRMQGTSQVKNCIISNFQRGIQMEASNPGDKIVSNTQSINNAQTGLIVGSTGTHDISGSTFSDNDSHGISIVADCTTTFDDITVHNNGDDGIRVDSTAAGTHVFSNMMVTSNTDHGMNVAGEGTYTITDSTFEGNTMAGIISTTGATMTAPTITIQDSTFNLNQFGIFLRDADGTIEGNVITASTGDGFVWRNGDITMNCCIITGSTNGGFKPQSSPPTGTATISNSLIYDNGSANISAQMTTMGKIYACDGGTVDLAQVSSDTSMVICDSIQGGSTCALDCTTNTLAAFDVSTECAAFPLVG